jgi:TonB family protein
MSETRGARALERSYHRRLELAILAALAIHGAAIVVVPPYVPRPYKLNEHPLRLVGAGFAGVGRMGASQSASSAPSDQAQPSASPAPFAFRSRTIVTEQVQVPPRAEPAGIPQEAGSRGGAGGSGGGDGSGEGAGDETPPVFYAFDSPPTVIRRVVPDYPKLAKLQQAEGTVVLNANVDEHGRVIRVWVAQAAAAEVLIQAAIDAMYGFQFSPGSQQGIPVKCTVAVPFNFRLNLHL